MNYARMSMHLSIAAFFLWATWMLNDVAPQIRGEITDLNRVTLSVGGTAAELRDAAKDWRAASKSSEQLSAQTLQVVQNTAQAMANLNSAAESLTALIQHTDSQINGTLLPQLAETVNQNDSRLTQLVEDTDATVVAMGKTSTQATAAMTQATQTLADAGKILGDPANQQTVKSVAAITQNTAEMTAHLNGAAADIQVKVHQMTRPASFIKQFGEDLFTLAAPVVSIFK